jgi:hypothetical protein
MSYIHHCIAHCATYIAAQGFKCPCRTDSKTNRVDHRHDSTVHNEFVSALKSSFITCQQFHGRLPVQCALCRTASGVLCRPSAREVKDPTSLRGRLCCARPPCVLASEAPEVHPPRGPHGVAVARRADSRGPEAAGPRGSAMRSALCEMELATELRRAGELSDWTADAAAIGAKARGRGQS